MRSSCPCIAALAIWVLASLGVAGTSASAGPAARRPSLPLAGKVVGIDPGHNGDNYTDPAYIDHLIWNGREQEACDTTGTETDGGYTEAQFNFNVATYLRRRPAGAGCPRGHDAQHERRRRALRQPALADPQSLRTRT